MNTGNLVIYKGKAAVITAVSKDKIDVRTQEGKSASVRMKDLELLHSGQVVSLNFPEPPQVDWAELTELADENGFTFAEFTELAYGESTPATAWFAWNALKEGVYFVGTPASGVKLQTPEKREELLRKKDEKDRDTFHMPDGLYMLPCTRLHKGKIVYYRDRLEPPLLERMLQDRLRTFHKQILVS